MSGVSLYGLSVCLQRKADRFSMLRCLVWNNFIKKSQKLCAISENSFLIKDYYYHCPNCLLKVTVSLTKAALLIKPDIFQSSMNANVILTLPRTASLETLSKHCPHRNASSVRLWQREESWWEQCPGPCLYLGLETGRSQGAPRYRSSSCKYRRSVLRCHRETGVYKMSYLGLQLVMCLDDVRVAEATTGWVYTFYKSAMMRSLSSFDTLTTLHMSFFAQKSFKILLLLLQ